MKHQTHTTARRYLHWLVALLAAGALRLSAALSAESSDAAAITGIEELRALASQSAVDLGARQGIRLTATAAPLDPRLRLPRCADHPRGLLTDDGQAREYVTVQLQCLAPTRWSVYVRVALQAERTVLVARQALARGATLSESDFESRLTTVSGTGTHYMSAEQLHGELQLRLPLASGALLTSEAVEQAPLIRRGQQLTLVARGAGIEIRVAATAMMDGRLAEHIRVQNQSTHRPVDAIVRSSELVEVGL
jgi:flagella basal body P-ring formation protein FlgA